jgi:hypothetical protein
MAGWVGPIWPKKYRLAAVRALYGRDCDGRGRGVRHLLAR